MTKIIKYKDGNVLKANNKRVVGFNKDGNYFLHIRHLSKEMCDAIRRGDLSYSQILVSDKNIHDLILKITPETLEMLYLSIGDMLVRNAVGSLKETGTDIAEE